MALIIAFVLTLIVKAPFGDAASFALREAWAMAALPMLLMIGFNLLLGFSPVRLLRDQLRARLAAAAEALETGDRAELRELLREGNAPFEPQVLATRLLRLVPRADARQIAADLRAGYALMLAVSALPDALDPARRARLAEQIRAAHAALGQGKAPAPVSAQAPAPVSAPAPAPARSPPRTRLIAQGPLEDADARADKADVDPTEGVAWDEPAEGAARADSAEAATWADPGEAATWADPAERAAWDALNVLAGAPEAEVVPAPKTPFVAPDALSNPAYIRFALKTTAAAVICFLIYTAIDWQGIHTAMVTCYVAALGTTGETVHKLALRIIGCLIGAAIGVAAIFWVIPHIDGIGALMALVFFGCLVGAWVSTGPERLSYAGVQVALAFLLTVLQGFGPSVSLDTAQGRIVGILLGNLVVYLIFTRLWPAPIVGEARALFARALSGLAGMARLAPARRLNAVSSAAAIEALVGKGEEVLRLLPFEPRALRPTPASEAALHGAVAEIEALNRAIWLSPDPDLRQTAEQLDYLAERFDGAAEASALDADHAGSGFGSGAGSSPGPDAGSSLSSSPNRGADCSLNLSPGAASSPTLHTDLAPFVGPFSRQLNQLQRAAG
ncbi:hypothetical protein CCR96_12095 [Halochromatium roseum]|nr:hypothetical protein [Halochromatium roseum]